MMLRAISILVAILILWLWPTAASAQNSITTLRQGDRAPTFFNQIDLSVLGQNQTVVKALPVQDKREIAVCGVTSTQVPSEVFLQSFRESMVRKSDAAILEIGRFNASPSIDDLRDLTLETRDTEDLRQCVVGDCKLKLSAAMIERFRTEIDWTAPDYRFAVARFFKQILVDYVREYLRQGDNALIRYDDKAKPVQLVDESRSLIASSSLPESIYKDSKLVRNAESQFSPVDEAIVWSKIKFGLKPVTAINHIAIYKSDQASGSQIVIVSKQIYANHYFDASLAVTAFGSIPGENSRSYLFYENRSRIDGLTGLFGKLKRGVIETQGVDSLQTILEKSQASLNARMNLQPISVSGQQSHWKAWAPGVLKASLWTFLILAFVLILMWGNDHLKKMPSFGHLGLASAAHQSLKGDLTDKRKPK